MKNIIITSFYIKVSDPQYQPQKKSRKEYNTENFNYMKKFYNSIIKFNLNCIIFHDGLSTNFLNKYSNDKIQFIKFNHENYKTNSGNDTRYIVYQEYLKDNIYNKIIISDISGIEFLKNPFEDLDENKIYVARDRIKTRTGGIRNMTHYWFKNNAINAYGSFDSFKPFENEYALCAGFFGGNYRLIIEILNNFEKEFKKVNLNYNTNFFVFNYIMYSKFKKKMIIGHSTHDGHEEKKYDDKIYIINIRNANVYGNLYWNI
jgi:hypothetical protein